MNWGVIFALPPTIRHASYTSLIPAAKRASSFRLRFSTTTTSISPEHNYGEALALLDSLQSNRSVVSTISNASRNINQDAIPEMLEWTRKAGYEVSDFAKQGLRCVHVAGTKGKGSVCVMVENILLQYRGETQLWEGGKGKHIGKVGLYTSPHLVTVRERIRIDGAPISESLFARYFFELWDRFSEIAAVPNGSHPHTQSSGAKPAYFRYLTLLAFHTFMREGVETAIIECGIGGEYDSTNILPQEAVTVSAITKLGIDHSGMLGETIEEIAWHKAGIMKQGVRAFTTQQVHAAQAILAARAREKDVALEVVNRNSALETGNVKLGIEGDFQKDNASLALAVTASHLQSLGVFEKADAVGQSLHDIPDKFIQGLATVKWQGRCEVRDEGNICWLIDGAHTIDSIKETARWYHTKLEQAIASATPPTATMLIFNQQERDAGSLINTLLLSIESSQPEARRLINTFQVPTKFRYAAFCTNTAFKDELGADVDLSNQESTAAVYERADRNSLFMCYGSVEEAVALARKVSEGDERLLVLVTGSLHLVGALLKVLESPRLGMGVKGG